MTSKHRCAGHTATGEPCAAQPLRDARFCYFHDPDLADDREKAQHLGRARRRRDASLATIYEFSSLATPEGKAQLLDIAARDTLALENTVARNRALGGFVQASIKVDEHTELRDRVKSLEPAVLANQGRSDSVYEQADDFDLTDERP
jgi:hypothetical protein